MQDLTPEGLRAVEEIASRHGVSVEAATVLLGAVAQGNGTQAQFNHPELGGMGQWSRGGMIMIGDMFNNGLKYRVDALCNDLSGLLARQAPFTPPPRSQSQDQSESVSLFVPGSASSPWWPSELGVPNSTGAQNDLRYALFAGAHRLAIRRDGVVQFYDTGDHLISGFSQQQGGDQSLTFSSQYGVVRVADLTEVIAAVPQETKAAASLPPIPPAPQHDAAEPLQAPEPGAVAPSPAPAPPIAVASSEQIFTMLERLAELRKQGILTENEFATKKAELLARL
jgi:hypothetical protein